jgi:Methyltransferase domain
VTRTVSASSAFRAPTASGSSWLHPPLSFQPAPRLGLGLECQKRRCERILPKRDCWTRTSTKRSTCRVSGPPRSLDPAPHSGRPRVRSQTVLDVACGTGEHARLLAAQGFVVDGLDLDPAFVRIAEQKHPAGQFFAADMRDFHLSPSVRRRSVPVQFHRLSQNPRSSKPSVDLFSDSILSTRSPTPRALDARVRSTNWAFLLRPTCCKRFRELGSRSTTTRKGLTDRGLYVARLAGHFGPASRKAQAPEP